MGAPRNDRHFLCKISGAIAAKAKFYEFYTAEDAGRVKIGVAIDGLDRQAYFYIWCAGVKAKIMMMIGRGWGLVYVVRLLILDPLSISPGIFMIFVQLVFAVLCWHYLSNGNA